MWLLNYDLKQNQVESGGEEHRRRETSRQHKQRPGGRKEGVSEESTNHVIFFFWKLTPLTPTSPTLCRLLCGELVILLQAKMKPAGLKRNK